MKYQTYSHNVLLLAAWLALALPFRGWTQFNYSINNGVATLTQYTGPGGEVVIPDTLGGYPVKLIGTNAFDNANSHTLLTSVTIPNSVTNIGDEAFNYCYNLTNATLGLGLTSIGHDAFFDCALLRTLRVPETVTSIDYGAFYGCSSLTNITLPSGLTGISEALFFFCTSLTNLSLPPGVTSIEGEAFLGCSSLTTVALPTNVTNIGVNAFQYCGSLQGVTLPNGLASLGAGAFSDCEHLTNISLPTSLISLGEQAFWYCISLTNIAVSPLNPRYASVGGVLYDKAVTTLLQYPVGRAGPYAVPLSVTNLPDYAFYYCPFLTSVTLPSGLKTVPDYAFEYDEALTQVALSEGITRIGYSAFLGCAALADVHLPSTVTTIGDLAFLNCFPLTSVTIPAGVTSFGQYVFNYCTNLQQVYFLGDAPSVNGGPGSADDTIFQSDNPGTVFYLPGAAGWGATFGGWPTAAGAYAPQPRIVASGPGFGVKSNQFTFTIAWATNTTVVVEASTNLVNWTPAAANQLFGGTSAFADPVWTNYSRRFYRVRLP